MKLVQNPHIEAGMGQLTRLRERSFEGYVRSCIEGLLASIDAGKYSFEDLGTTETEVLDLAIGHVGEELLRGQNYPFAFLKLHNDLVCRKSRIKGFHPMYHQGGTAPVLAPANDRKAA